MTRYFLVDINQYLNPIDPLKPLSIWILLIEALGLISPILVLLILVGIRKYQKQRGTLTNACISIGDLFKRNSTDTISEKWLVSREIGTIELTEALEGFTKKETISEDCRFILIIDNLDRISGDKVKELWSDMELIAGVTHEQFRVVVPYSAIQVAKSLAVEGHRGQVFSNETDRWSEYLMSVHYQTEIALARSELIDTPLINAIGTFVAFSTALRIHRAVIHHCADGGVLCCHNS